MNKNTLLINFIASPSSGKSTMSAELFAMLKWNKVDCELVSEFAKELVWEERNETFKDELYIFGKQNHRLFRVNGKVDIMITDRPIILSSHYNRKYGDASENFDNLVLETHYKYNNFNIFINRTKDYNPNGRNQTEEESNEMSVEIKDMLNEFGIEFTEVNGDKQSVQDIYEMIMDIINLK